MLPGGTPGVGATTPLRAPNIDGFELVGGRVLFQFNADAGVSYTILYQESLAEPPQVLREFVSEPSARLITVEDDLTAGNGRFYRIRAQ